VKELSENQNVIGYLRAIEHELVRPSVDPGRTLALIRNAQISATNAELERDALVAKIARLKRRSHGEAPKVIVGYASAKAKYRR
jgi:hypothetical protein